MLCSTRTKPLSDASRLDEDEYCESLLELSVDISGLVPPRCWIAKEGSLKLDATPSPIDKVGKYVPVGVVAGERLGLA